IVPSLRGVCERAAAAGHAIVGYDDSNPEWREAFLHPKRALGIVVQLVEIVETRPRSDGERRSRWVVPPGPPNPAACDGARAQDARALARARGGAVGAPARR